MTDDKFNFTETWPGRVDPTSPRSGQRIVSNYAFSEETWSGYLPPLRGRRRYSDYYRELSRAESFSPFGTEVMIRY